MPDLGERKAGPRPRRKSQSCTPCERALSSSFEPLHAIEVFHEGMLEQIYIKKSLYIIEN